jgi:transcriptional regulator with XRE-family HTH domain
MVSYSSPVAQGSQGAQSVDALYVALGRRIAKLRKDRGLTQAGLAGVLGLTRASIANIERGRQKFLVHTVLQLVAALGVSPNKLLAGLGAPAHAQLDALLEDRPAEVRDWIRSAVGSRSRGERKRDGGPAKVHP